MKYLILGLALFSCSVANASSGFTSSSCSSFNSACTSACNDANSTVAVSKCTNVIASCQGTYAAGGFKSSSADTLKSICRSSCGDKMTFDFDPISLTAVCQCTGDDLDYQTNEKCKSYIENCLTNTCNNKYAITAYCAEESAESKCTCSDSPAHPTHSGTAKPKNAAENIAQLSAVLFSAVLVSMYMLV